MSMQDAQHALDRAKMTLATKPNSVFISTIVFSLKFSWDNTTPTACTDGTDLIVNPDFFMSLNDYERVFLLEHEAYHVAFQHMLRYGERDFRTWNMATDYVINAMLIKAGGKMPDGGLYEAKYANCTSEEVYDRLVQNPPPEAKNFIPDMSDGSKNSPEEIEEEIKEILVKAVIQSKRSNDEPGTIPGDIERALDELLNPKLPWHIILANYMTALAPDDYSMRRPNRRYLPDFYMPSLWGESIGEIAVAIDTSGSISQDQLNAFFTEVHFILERMQPDKITVIDFDTEINSVNEVKDPDDIKNLRFSGCGGTRIHEVMQWAADNQPLCMIVFTDGYFHQPEIDPKTPIVWAIHGECKFKPKWGTTIAYPL